MPTKLLLSLTAFVFGLPGLFLLFAPDVALACFGSAADPAATLCAQLAGGFAVAIGINNWMARGAALGGIYGRPLLVADLAALLITGLGLLKAPRPAGAGMALQAAGVVFLLFAAAFGRLLFAGPGRGTIDT